MKQYEYRQLYERITLRVSAPEFMQWVYEKLNEWGKEGWFITQYSVPMLDKYNFTGELVATGCRELQPAEVEQVPSVLRIPGAPSDERE